MPLSDRQRVVLFWTVCIPTRMSIAAASLYAGYRAPAPATVAMAGVAAVVSLTLAINFARGVAGTAPLHGRLGGEVWWKYHRVVHAACYASFAVATFARLPWAGLFLLGDVVYASAAAAVHHAWPN